MELASFFPYTTLIQPTSRRANVNHRCNILPCDESLAEETFLHPPPREGGRTFLKLMTKLGVDFEGSMIMGNVDVKCIEFRIEHNFGIIFSIMLTDHFHGTFDMQSAQVTEKCTL